MSTGSGLWAALVIMVCYWTGVWVSSRDTKGMAGLASALGLGLLVPYLFWEAVRAA